MNTPQRQKILNLLKEKKVITSSELAQHLGVSWNTSEKYLLELGMDNKVIKLKKQGVNLWMLK